jgi:ankyrin repeat protein
VCKSLSEKADPSASLKGSKTTPIQRALDLAEKSLACEDVIASRDYVLIIMALVVAGAKLTCVNEDRQTPLIHAVKGAMGDSLACLMLEYGADVNATDKEQNTALHYATMQHASAEWSNVDTIRTLLAFGADQHIRNQRGRTALYKAII